MIRFKKDIRPYNCFSNFYPCTVVVDGMQFRSAEAAFQAQKVPLEKRRDFIFCTPSAAKHLGRHVPLPADWDDVRDEAMHKVVYAPKDKFRVTADKSSLDKSDKTWSLIINDIKANSILPACKTDAGTLRDMYAMYAKRCSSCGLRFVRNYSVGSSTGTKAPAIIEVVLPDNSIGYYLLMCKANETKSGPSLRDAMPLISSMLMMESNGKRVLGAYFIADRFSNGFVQDVSRLVEPINRNRTDRFEIRVCDTNTPLVLAVPAVSTQAAPVNINVGITIKKTR